MAVSQDIQDFCAALPGRVAATVSAAEAAANTANTQALADLQAKFDAAMAQAQQDHADEVAALKSALDQAAPSQTT